MPTDHASDAAASATETLRALGGVAAVADVVAATSRRRLRTAVRRGEVVAVTRGRVALAEVRGHRLLAARRSATLSHLSAAQHWGWAVKDVPVRCWMTVPRNRKVPAADRATAEVFYADLSPHDVQVGVTSPLATVLACSRVLPFDEALAVADSALRAGDVDPFLLLQSALAARGPGAAQLRRVVRAADARAANPFESVLRAIALEVGGLDLVPQVEVRARGLLVHPDLVDAGRRVVVEADSWGFHADRLTHGRDCVRYSALAVEGWVVLRFTWEQVMHSAPYVRAVLDDLVATFDDPARGAKRGARPTPDAR